MTKKDGNSFLFRVEKSSQTSQKAVLETVLGKVIFIYLLGLGRSRMVAGKPFFFKSDHGRDMQGTLPSRPSKQTGGRGILWFSLSLHLLGLASSLGWERGWVGALPLLYSY